MTEYIRSQVQGKDRLALPMTPTPENISRLQNWVIYLLDEHYRLQSRISNIEKIVDDKAGFKI